MKAKGTKHWLSPIEDPTAPHAVPIKQGFTTYDTADVKHE